MTSGLSNQQPTEGQEQAAAVLSAGAHLDVAASVACSEELGRRVRNSGFMPDVVVGIREGGILPARVIAADLGREALNITVRRRVSGIKHTPVFRLVGRYFGNYLVRFSFVRRMLGALNRVPGRSVSTSTAGGMPPPAIGPTTRVLVVDDFSCSGETFVAAVKWLTEQGASVEHVRTAALIAAPDPARGPLYFPTYMLVNVPWVFFPWSSNSPHYNEYLRWKESGAR